MTEFVTAEELAQDVIKNVGLVSGTGVQIYTEPNVYASIQRMFDMLFRKRNWDWLCDWRTYTIDGTTGLVTGTFEDICDFAPNIVEIRDSNSDRKIATPSGREYLRASGSDAIYYRSLLWNDDNYLTKLIKFYPITATNDVDILIKNKPENFVPADTVPFPRDVIAHAATWDLLDSDGINPTASAKAQSLFDLTYRDLIEQLSEDSIGIGGGRANVPLTIRPL